MSNKQEDTTMKPATKRVLVPKLRFPEFRDAGGWEIDHLGQAADFVSERIQLEKIRLENYVSTENILPDFGGVVKASNLPTTGSVTRFKINDVLVSNIRPYLKKVWRSDKDGGASNDVIVLRAKQYLVEQFFPFILRNDAFIDYVMKGAKGVKMPRGDVSLMRQYPIGYPSPAEQQKIADCLSSIDELVTLEAQKLDTLKAHKKGLMQQLFPVEGETLPKLCFPEFREAGEWNYMELDPFLQEYSERVSANTGIPIYSSTRTGLKFQRDYYDNRELENGGEYGLVPEGYFVYRHMSDDGAFKFNINKTGGKIAVSKEYPVFTTVDLHPDFLLYLLNDGEDFKAFAFAQKKGGTRTRLYLKTLRTWKALLPSHPEQQKIAECLSSLDELITAQTQKLDTLKVHKKGLMQQLFPALDEVQG